MKTTPVAAAVAAVLLCSSVHVLAQDKPPKAAARDVFEAENFSLSAPKGALKKVGGNGLNTISLQAPNMTKGESPHWILNDNTPEGLRGVGAGRIDVVKPAQTAEERRTLAQRWADNRSDDEYLDKDSFKNARWHEEEGRHPRVLVRRVDITPRLPEPDLKIGDYVKSRRLTCVGAEMLVFHSGGLYHLFGWGFAGPKLDRGKLAAQIDDVLLSFELKKETTLSEDRGFSFKAPDGLNNTPGDDGFHLSRPDKNQGVGDDEKPSWGPPRFMLAYRAENQLGTGDEEDPPLEGKKLDDVVRQFGRMFRPHYVDRAGMNTITVSRVGSSAKSKFAGQDARLVEATFTFVAKHMRMGGGFDYTREEMGATALMVQTNRGVLVLLAVYLARDKAAMTADFNAIRDGVELVPSNIPQPRGK